MNTAFDQKKVDTFLFTFNYMQQPWRLDPPAGQAGAKPSASLRSAAAEPMNAVRSAGDADPKSVGRNR